MASIGPLVTHQAAYRDRDVLQNWLPPTIQSPERQLAWYRSQRSLCDLIERNSIGTAGFAIRH